VSRLERELTDLKKFVNLKELDLELPSEFHKPKPRLWDKAFCPCGGIILADTEECTVPVCIECAIEISKAYSGNIEP